MKDATENMFWDDVLCPICLDIPHNCVLLKCTSYEKGCRPFVCDTDHLHSNCLARFESSYGIPSFSNPFSLEEESLTENMALTKKDEDFKPFCPLCRGEVTGWTVVEVMRIHLDQRKRGCEEHRCTFMGTYIELLKHVRLEHPHARPSKIDPAKQLDWENFQQSSAIIDVLSTIHSEIPHGVVLGDYVIEYTDDDTGDEFENFHRRDGKWWKSCIFYQVFDKFRTSRNRRRSRIVNAIRARHRLSNDNLNSDEGSVTSIDDEAISTSGTSRGTPNHRSSSRRRNSRFNYH